jgi:hypothetical protein
MKLVHIANLAGGALYTFVGFMGVAHGIGFATIAGGVFLVGVGCVYTCGALYCLVEEV